MFSLMAISSGWRPGRLVSGLAMQSINESNISASEDRFTVRDVLLIVLTARQDGRCHPLLRFGEDLLGLHDREHRLPGLSIAYLGGPDLLPVASVMPWHGHIIVQDDGETLKRQIQDDLVRKKHAIFSS